MTRLLSVLSRVARFVAGHRRLRELSLLLIDGVVAVSALVAAMWLRFDGQIPPPIAAIMAPLAAILVTARLLAAVLMGTHRWSFRLSGLVDGARVTVAAAFGSGLFLLGVFMTRLNGMPRSVVAIEFLVSAAVMGIVRFSPRLTLMYVGEQVRSHRAGASHTLIVGAGSTGELLLRDLQRSGEHGFSVIGFLDDNPAIRGLYVGGKPVLGTIGQLPEVARRFHVETVLLAIPRLAGRRVREILGMCGDLKLNFKILPVSYLYVDNHVSASMLQELQPDDLLPREPVALTGSSSDSLPRLSERTALVTGAAGSIGGEICRQLLGGGLGRLVMVDLNENELYLLARRLERDFPENDVRLEVADIRDAGRMDGLFAGYRPHDVFHAAAHKHVPLMELTPCEAVKNNILGTQNVAEAAHRHGTERFVYISTDKAVRPTSVMGVSKRVGEKVVRLLGRESDTRFVAVRFGNVLGSAGSVVPLFRAQIAAGGPVTVTDPEVKRFFMTITEAVGLVLKAGYGDYGGLCVLDMGEQLRIVDLARHMITMAGKVPGADIPIVFTGLRPGEKLYEELLTEDEERTVQVDRKIFVAESPPVREDLWVHVAELAEAAHAEEPSRVVELLQRLVPTYTPAANGHGGAAMEEGEMVAGAAAAWTKVPVPSK
jgi:FlaA1/EpsC-like NDP-sugar epimerase